MHTHIFRRWVKSFAVPGWLGWPDIEFGVKFWRCRCGEIGYGVPA